MGPKEDDYIRRYRTGMPPLNGLAMKSIALFEFLSKVAIMESYATNHRLVQVMGAERSTTCIQVVMPSSREEGRVLLSRPEPLASFFERT